MLSFEFFPPRTDSARDLLEKTVQVLAELSPDFMTVTYGAGGTSRDLTFDIVRSLQTRTAIPMASHLTCIVTPKQDIMDIADYLWAHDIHHIVALRGDAPADMALPVAGDPAYYAVSSDLVRGLLARHPFEISVAAYPEKHPEAPSLMADIEALRQKFDAGAKRAITQFFFNNESFYRFRDIFGTQEDRPVRVGILPITNFAKTCEFAGKCGTSIPDWLHERFAKAGDHLESQKDIAFDVLCEQIIDLRQNGVESFHFYTLNQSDMIYRACKTLSLA